LDTFNTAQGPVKIDERTDEIKSIKMPFAQKIDFHNAAWYFRQYTFLDDKNNRTTGTDFGFIPDQYDGPILELN